MFDIEKETKKVIEWTSNWFNSKGSSSLAILCISGGVDSSTVAAILKEAIGSDRIIGIKLPCDEQKDIDCSDLLINHLGLKAYEINIGASYNELTSSIISALGKDITEQYKTNTPARIRMTAAYGVAAIVGNAYPVNTCQASETFCGYDTIFGDSAGSVAPIALFTKTEVKQIAKYLGLPEKLYNKTPIDGMSLNEDGSYKTDEQKLGFTYEELDDFIRNGTIGSNNEKIVKQMKSSKWKRNIINIEHYIPEVEMIPKDLW